MIEDEDSLLEKPEEVEVEEVNESIEPKTFSSDIEEDLDYTEDPQEIEEEEEENEEGENNSEIKDEKEEDKDDDREEGELEDGEIEDSDTEANKSDGEVIDEDSEMNEKLENFRRKPIEVCANEERITRPQPVIRGIPPTTRPRITAPGSSAVDSSWEAALARGSHRLIEKATTIRKEDPDFEKKKLLAAPIGEREYGRRRNDSSDDNIMANKKDLGPQTLYPRRREAPVHCRSRTRTPPRSLTRNNASPISFSPGRDASPISSDTDEEAMKRPTTRKKKEARSSSSSSRSSDSSNDSSSSKSTFASEKRKSGLRNVSISEDEEEQSTKVGRKQIDSKRRSVEKITRRSREKDNLDRRGRNNNEDQNSSNKKRRISGSSTDRNRRRRNRSSSSNVGTPSPTRFSRDTNRKTKVVRHMKRKSGNQVHSPVRNRKSRSRSRSRSRTRSPPPYPPGMRPSRRRSTPPNSDISSYRIPKRKTNERKRRRSINRGDSVPMFLKKKGDSKRKEVEQISDSDEDEKADKSRKRPRNSSSSSSSSNSSSSSSGEESDRTPAKYRETTPPRKRSITPPPLPPPPSHSSQRKSFSPSPPSKKRSVKDVPLPPEPCVSPVPPPPAPPKYEQIEKEENNEETSVEVVEKEQRKKQKRQELLARLNQIDSRLQTPPPKAEEV